jgi:hypothetical protein
VSVSRFDESLTTSATKPDGDIGLHLDDATDVNAFALERGGARSNLNATLNPISV